MLRTRWTVLLGGATSREFGLKFENLTPIFSAAMGSKGAWLTSFGRPGCSPLGVQTPGLSVLQGVPKVALTEGTLFLGPRPHPREYPHKGTCSQPPGFSTTRIPSTPDKGHSTRPTYCSLSLRQDESLQSPLLALWKLWTLRESARIGHYHVSSCTTMVAKSPLWWCLHFIGSRNSSAQNFRITWFCSPSYHSTLTILYFKLCLILRLPSDFFVFLCLDHDFGTSCRMTNAIASHYLFLNLISRHFTTAGTWSSNTGPLVALDAEYTCT